MDICICTTETLCYTPETSTMLEINHTLKLNWIKFKYKAIKQKENWLVNPLYLWITKWLTRRMIWYRTMLVNKEEQESQCEPSIDEPMPYKMYPHSDIPSCRCLFLYDSVTLFFSQYTSCC